MDVHRRAGVRDVERALVRRQREAVGIFAEGEHGEAAVGRHAVDARAVPQVVLAGGARDLALPIGPALVRVGEIKAAVRAAHHVVGAIEAPALVAFGDGLDPAVGIHARDLAAVALAQDQVALEIEGRAVAAGGFPHDFRLLAGRDPVEPVGADVHEVIKPVGMPQRALGKDEAGREALG
ncbi:hypothetical protein D3C83_02200 [compost metagenome]